MKITEKILPLKVDKANGIVVLEMLPGVVFLTINSQFAHLAKDLVEIVNNHLKNELDRNYKWETASL